MTMNLRRISYLLWLCLCCRCRQVRGFGVASFDASTTLHFLNAASSTFSHQIHAVDVADAYRQMLTEHPLPTKMATGATLAVIGDAIAQSKALETKYDSRRALSFAVFDGCYRALQHVAFPFLTTHLQGQILGSIATVGLTVVTTAAMSSPVSPEFCDPVTVSHVAAAMEQTLASQLIIVPFLYYPVFFALTGSMQGLDVVGSIHRARDNFVPLMKRNLVFWIPVQFVQFAWIPTEYQIGFLSCAGLAWTVILSVIAGSAQKYYTTPIDTSIQSTTMTIQPDRVVGVAETESFQSTTAVIQVTDFPNTSANQLVEA